MAGYSGTPLARKLGYKPGFRVCVLGAPAQYMQWLEPLPDGIRFLGRPGKDLDLIHLFVTRKADLAARLPRLMAAMRADGMIWISWPKRSSGQATDVTEDVIRSVALPMHLVDVKVCAVSDVWSGLKLVIRKTHR